MASELKSAVMLEIEKLSKNLFPTYRNADYCVYALFQTLYVNSVMCNVYLHVSTNVNVTFSFFIKTDIY